MTPHLAALCIYSPQDRHIRRWSCFMGRGRRRAQVLLLRQPALGLHSVRCCASRSVGKLYVSLMLAIDELFFVDRGRDGSPGGN